MSGHEDLNALVASLRALATKKATPERRTVVREALSNKHEGAQSVAAQVLGSWGGPESRDDLRAWFSRLALRHRPFSGPRRVALKELARCIGTDDTDWVLDLYFGQAGITETHEYLGLASAVEPNLARSRILKELRNPDPVKRHAALKLIWPLQLEDFADLARPLVDDEDDTTRRLAKALVQKRNDATPENVDPER